VITGDTTVGSIPVDKVFATSGTTSIKYIFATVGDNTLLLGNGLSASGATVGADGYPTVLSQTLTK
jgi:hypothetical protein